MLTFLRKIRMAFIKSGSTRKYLLYAIGEIALVVIGILIALQVNNLNESRKERILEVDYLNRFMSDLKTDSTNLDLIKDVLSSKKNAMNMIQSLLDGEDCCQDAVNVIIRRSATMGWVLIDEGSDATFQEMIASGDLRLINNNRLRQEILKYYKIWESTYNRVEKRSSAYPNLTYQLFDLEGDENNAEWFWTTLKENKAENEFRRHFRHETRYADFIERTALRLLSELHENLKHLIVSELEEIG